MKRLRRFLPSNRILIWSLLILGGLGFLLLYRLGTLTNGLSNTELQTLQTPLGWHGLYHNPFDLPLQLVRSAVFFAAPDHGHLLLRLPNVLFGALSIASFAWLIWLWHGPRTTIMATLLFATGAWTLHVSRLASLDVMYLWATPTLLLVQLLLQDSEKRARTWFLGLFVLGALLYIPGFIWLMLWSLFVQRKVFRQAWGQFNRLWQRFTAVAAVTVWLPLLALHLSRAGQWRAWLGLPDQFAPPLTLLENFAGVFVHLFVRGPQYPDLWLAKAPLLDAFTLVACLCGVYFYLKRWRSKRSRLLIGTFLIGAVLVALGGPVGLSVLVPLLYMAAATGIAFLLHDWLKTFPNNPLARGFGIGLMFVVVSMSCLYNLRAYFIAWPHNAVTKETFRHQRLQ